MDASGKNGSPYAARREKVYEYLRNEKIRVAVLEDTENRRNTGIRYLTGHPEDALLFLFDSGKSILAPWDVHLADSLSEADEIIPYNDLGRQFVTAIPEVLEREKTGKNIRLELPSATPYPLVRDVQEKLPGVEPICRWNGLDASISTFRMIKDAAEIAILREASRITDAVISGLETLFAKPDLSETEAALYIEGEARKLGAEGTGFETIVAGPSRSFGIHAFPPYSAAVFGTDGLSVIDFGIKYRGYTSDVTLTVVRGRLSQDQKKKVSLVKQAYELAVSMLKPGASTLSVALAVDELFEKNGERMPHALGHGIGLEAHESPFIRTRKDSDRILAPGMVVTIEPGLYHPETGGVRLENDALITDRGCEILTSSRIFTY